MAEGRQDRNSFFLSLFLSLSLRRPFFFWRCSEIEHRVPVDKPVLYGNRTGSSCGQPLKNPVGQDQPDQKQGTTNTQLSSQYTANITKKGLTHPRLFCFVSTERAFFLLAPFPFFVYTRDEHINALYPFFALKCVRLFLWTRRVYLVSREDVRVDLRLGIKKFCKRYN